MKQAWYADDKRSVAKLRYQLDHREPAELSTVCRNLYSSYRYNNNNNNNNNNFKKKLIMYLKTISIQHFSATKRIFGTFQISDK